MAANPATRAAAEILALAARRGPQGLVAAWQFLRNRQPELAEYVDESAAEVDWNAFEQAKPATPEADPESFDWSAFEQADPP
jgi:hypothetical protein